MDALKQIASRLVRLDDRLARLESKDNAGVFGFPTTLTGGWVDFGNLWLGYRLYLHRDFFMVDGLIKSGTISNDVPAARLPGGYLSAERLLSPTISNDALGSINAPYLGGSISVRGGTNTYVSLNGTRIPLHDWYQPALQNSWVVFGRDNATQGYCYDRFGVLTLKGLLASGTASAAIITLPFGSVGLAKARIYGTIANNAFSRVDIRSDGTVQQITGSNVFLSLNGLSTPVGNTWTAPTLSGSWANYGTVSSVAYAEAGYWKDATGIVHLDGVIKSGTIGTAAFTLPDGYRPAADVLRLCASNDALGRVDIKTDGTVTPIIGNTAYVSLCGLKFMAAQ